MTNGFKDKDGKFHPINTFRKKSNKTVKKSNKEKTLKSEGIKINSKFDMINPDNQEITKAVETALNRVNLGSGTVKTLTIKNFNPNEKFIANINVQTGELVMPKNPMMAFPDYETLAVHELNHMDLENRIANDTKRTMSYFQKALDIEPFTNDLFHISQLAKNAKTKNEFDQAVQRYVEEVHSNTAESMERRNFKGLPNEIINQNEFEKAKKIYKELHSE